MLMLPFKCRANPFKYNDNGQTARQIIETAIAELPSEEEIASLPPEEQEKARKRRKDLERARRALKEAPKARLRMNLKAEPEV
jgi:hypothetical protein